jgi:hypothetical protein
MMVMMLTMCEMMLMMGVAVTMKSVESESEPPNARRGQRHGKE